MCSSVWTASSASLPKMSLGHRDLGERGRRKEGGEEEEREEEGLVSRKLSLTHRKVKETVWTLTCDSFSSASNTNTAP